MKLNTRVFELYKGKYGNLLELARTMGISKSQIYRVRDGKRGINQKFIIGATKAFPEYNLDDLFYVDAEGQPVKSSNKWPEFRDPVGKVKKGAGGFEPPLAGQPA